MLFKTLTRMMGQTIKIKTLMVQWLKMLQDKIKVREIHLSNLKRSTGNYQIWLIRLYSNEGGFIKVLWAYVYKMHSQSNRMYQFFVVNIK